jgi:sarcosine oxidase subunit beta
MRVAGEFDVGIVGAGVHGASAAYHLASRGVRAVLFEKGMPAGGPTGRSSAVCRAYYTNEFLARAAHESIEMLATFAELTGGDAGYRRTGALFLHPPGDVEQVERNVPRLNQIGIVCEALRPEDVAARFPAFSLDGVAVAVWERDAGYTDPAGTTLGLFNRAVEQGVEPRMRTAVAAIEPEDAGGATLLAGDGSRTRCRRVLLAAGPWTRPLAAQVGIDLPLTVERHVVATFGWGGARPAPLHADVPNGYYLKPEGALLFLVGPLRPEQNVDPDRFNERITDEEIRSLSAAITRRVPELERAESHGGWASLYDVSPDWQPVIGEVAPGIFVDAGTSGHGFKLAPALGRHVAAMVLGEGPPALEQFHPRRFAAGATLGAGYGEARILG